MAPGPEAAAGTPGEAELLRWAHELAQRHFGVPFSGAVRWAPRLRYRAGDYTPATGVIRLSLPYFRRYGAAETRRILAHELCHWWLFRQGIRHREDAAEFQSMLRSIGAPVRAKPLARRQAATVRIYACPHCGARYRYPRRVDYACGPCCRRFTGGHFDPRFRLMLCSSAAR